MEEDKVEGDAGVVMHRWIRSIALMELRKDRNVAVSSPASCSLFHSKTSSGKPWSLNRDIHVLI